jgi:hypothetical protein
MVEIHDRGEKNPMAVEFQGQAYSFYTTCSCDELTGTIRTTFILSEDGDPSDLTNFH